MLQLSSDAATMLSEACQEQGMTAENAGVRIAGVTDDGGELNLEVLLQEEPEAGDQVSEQEGIRLFVAPEVAERLAELRFEVVDPGDGPKLKLIPQQ